MRPSRPRPSARPTSPAPSRSAARGSRRPRARSSRLSPRPCPIGQIPIRFDPPFSGEPISKRVSDSGLEIEDFVAGEGPEVANGSTVNVLYTGYLTDGTIFDTTARRGNRPFKVAVGGGRVIQAWEEGLRGMRAGGKRKLIVPPKLGYGDRPAGKIPPGSTLIFTMEVTGHVPPLPDPQPLSLFDGEPVARKKLDGGLEVIDYKLGDGAEAVASPVVHVHYRGTLTKDGTEFDSSYPRKRALDFTLGAGRVIKGWDQGLVGMRVGGLRKLIIPAALAYGERARGKIPANADLTFVVELMRVEPPPPADGGK